MKHQIIIRLIIIQTLITRPIIMRLRIAILTI